MYLSVEGEVSEILQPRTFTKKDGTSNATKSIVVQTRGYQRNVPVVVRWYADNKNVSDLNSVKVGDNVVLNCELVSREWNGNWFSETSVLKIVSIESHNTQQQQQQQPVQQTQPQQPAQQSNNPMQGIPTLQQNGQPAQQSAQTDDLPF